VHPQSLIDWDRFFTLRRILLLAPEAHAPYLRVWNRRNPEIRKDDTINGPVLAMRKAATRMDLAWASPWAFARDQLAPIPIVGGPLGWTRFEIKQQIEGRHWRNLECRRSSFQGIAAGIDRHATTGILDGKSKIVTLDGYQRGALRSIHSGAYRPQKKLFAAGMCDSPLCACCALPVEEDERHTFASCPKWNNIRILYYPDGLPKDIDQWPSCLVCHGLVPAQKDRLRLRGALPNLEPFSEETDSEPEDASDSPEFKDEEGRISVYIDGSRDGPGYAPWIHRAGAGVFFGPGHWKNIAIPVLGPVQTSPRAELLALYRALRAERRPMNVLGDCFYSLDGAWGIQDGETPNEHWEHSDLWAATYSLLQRRDVKFYKVKAHVETHEVNSLRAAQDKFGNDEADGLAKLGREIHNFEPNGYEEREKRLRPEIVKWQSMQLHILLSRMEFLKSSVESLSSSPSAIASLEWTLGDGLTEWYHHPIISLNSVAAVNAKVPFGQLV